MVVHHLNYKFIFHEKDGLNTLVLLCADCHDIVHGYIPDNRVLSDSALDIAVKRFLES